MRKILLLIVLFGATITGVRAQVGIGTQDPDPAAQLEIRSSPEKRGLLIPRIVLTSIDMTLSGTQNDKAKMPNSILVFNTGTFNATIDGASKSFGPGYYYWDVEAKGADGVSTKGAWVALLSGGTSKNIQNFFNSVNTNSSTVVYNSASNTFDLRVGNGLKNLTDTSGNPYVGLGGALTTNTTVDLGTSKLNIKGLQTSTVHTDEIVVVNQSTGELKVVKGVSSSQIDVHGGTDTQVLTVEGGKAVWKSIVSGSGGLINGENGITTMGDKVRLGGNLVSPTVITTDAVNTLAIQGLQTSTTGTDKLVVTDAAGILKTVTGVTTAQINAAGNKGKFLTVDNNGVVTWTSFGGTSTSSIDFSGLAGDGLVFNSASGTLDVKAGNGLKVENDIVKLGGDLTEKTIITTGAVNTLAIQGLQTSTTGTDKIVVTDADGVLKTVTGVTTAQINANGNKGKFLTVDNNGVVTWTSFGGTSTSSIDFSGLAGDGLVFNSASGTLDVQAGNGITIEGDKVNWGGELTKTATIVTDADKAFVIKPKGGTRTTSNVVIENLPTGTVSDSFVVVDGDGNLKTVDPKSAAKIDYTDGPQETGRRWKLDNQNLVVQEITFVVTFTNSATVDIAKVLKDKHIILDNKELKVLSIRAIEKTGTTKNDNNKPTSITQSGVYDPNTGYLMLGMSSSTLFSVKFNGTFYIVVEFIKLQ